MIRAFAIAAGAFLLFLVGLAWLFWPRRPPTSTPDPETTMRSFLRLLNAHRPAAIAGLIIGVFLGFQLGCKPYLPPNTHPIVDCVNAQRPSIDSLITSFWPKDGGAPDWSKIESVAIDAGITIGGCALAEFVQAYLAPPPGRMAPDDANGVRARDALERYRNKHANNAVFRTADGDL